MVPKERKQALRQIHLLSQRIGELKALLEGLDDGIAILGTRLEEGDPIIEALQRVGGSFTVPKMLQMFDDFHAARQNLRVALLAIARQEEVSASMLARTIGISKQLASRLEAEAAQEADRR